MTSQSTQSSLKLDHLEQGGCLKKIRSRELKNECKKNPIPNLQEVGVNSRGNELFLVHFRVLITNLVGEISGVFRKTAQILPKPPKTAQKTPLPYL